MGGQPNIVPAPLTRLERWIMVSSTRQTERRRNPRAKSTAAARTRSAARITPKFAVHPEGYDPKAADAKPSKASS